MGGSSSSSKVRECTGTTGEFDYVKYLFKDTGKYTIAMDDTEEKECSQIYRNPGSAEGLHTEGIILPEGDKLKTIWELWQRATKKFAAEKFLGYRPLNADGTYAPYTFETFAQVDKIVEGIAKGLAKAGVGKDTNVGIFSQNRPEWTESMIAILGRAARIVALYDTLGEEALTHIIGQAKTSVLFTEVTKLKVLGQLVEHVEDLALKTVVVFNAQDKYGNAGDVLDPATVEAFKAKGVTVVNLTDFIAEAADIEDAYLAPTADQLAILMYTSGTTGVPKGVMLTHNSLCVDLQGAAEELLAKHLVQGDTHFSYLPLAHIFEMIVEMGCMLMGLNICYFTGSMKRLAFDLGEAQPHLFCGVPRVYSKFYAKFHAQVDGGSWFSKKVARAGVKSSSSAIRDGNRSGFYDKVVWKKVALKMGLSRAKICLTGAAPMPGYLAEFVRIVANCPIVQGYGLTETAAASTVTHADDLSVGHVGYPLKCAEIRLRDVAEMNYKHTDQIEVEGKKVAMPRGEIEIRGAHLFRGYYQMQAKTDEVLSKDGWFSTGDIGRINPNGTLSIIDRKKNIFKMSQGEYIATEKIENVYNKAASVGQIWVYGNSFKSFIVAVIVPDAQYTTVVLKNLGKWDYDGTPALGTQEFADLFTKKVGENLEAVYNAVKTDMANNTGKLKGFEKIRDIHIEFNIDDILQGFSPENGLLTPSFKLKRPNLINRYVKEVQDLYTKNKEPPQKGEKWGNK